jgi:hypothetical protein
MTSFQRALFAVVVLGATAIAQQGVPHAAYVYPAGGKVGTTFEATIGGQFLNNAHDVVVSGKGIKAEVIGFEAPLPPQQMQAMRDEVQKIVASHGGVPGRPNAQQQQQQNPANANRKRPPVAQPDQITPWTPADADRARQLRETIAESQRRQQSPSLSQSAKLRITIAPDAQLGDHEFRLVTNLGLSNPVVFCVDRLAEVSRPLQHVPLDLARGGGLAVGEQVRAASAAIPLAIMLPAMVNGQMMPGSVDRYKFHAVKGQQIVIAAKTRALIPYISDAVPGWFQAKLTLSDAAGRELASADHFRFSQDPVIEQQIPADGEYVLSVHDAIFRGREDFVYRIAIGELPYVTGIFPLGGKENAKTRLDLAGWNLASSRFTPSTRGAGLHLLGAESGWTANPVSFAVDSLPETTHTQPSTSTKNAKKIKLPVVINGRIAKPGDMAIFRIDAKSGDEIVAEVSARRLGSPLDSTLTLIDAKGTQLAFNDDADAPKNIGAVVESEENGSALLTHQADSHLSFRFSAKGTYYLELADAQHNGGADFAYRLRISRPQPDFELRVVPSSLSVRPGMTVPATVYVLRRDGFNGEVALKIKDAPPGLNLSGGTIPAGADSVRVTLTAPPQAIAAPHTLLLEGEAQIAGRAVHRVGVPADDMEQAFAWHHLVPAKDGLVLVFGAGRRNPMWKVADDRIKVPAGGTAQIRVGISAAQMAQQVTLALSNPPEGISIVDVTKRDNTLEVRLRADNKVKPGLKGNLIVEASMIRPRNAANPNPGPNANRPVPIGTLPAIPFEIVQP